MTRLVLRNAIENWAERIDSKGDLPYLVSRLVRATTPFSTQVDIPAGSTAYIGGWDGVVVCKEDTAYVPEGTSLWEFGTEADTKGKADKDYDKRKVDPLGHALMDSTFIFVTPRFWKGKDKWVKAKKAEGVWKDVKAYDSSTLEQWLDTALATARWFAGKIGSYPFDGIMTADEFWEEWSIGPDSKILLPEVVTSGREFEQQKLLGILQGKATIIGVKASTKQEAIAFIIATAKQFPENDLDRFFSKSLVIDTEGNFRGIRINTITPLNLIPRFDETQPLYAAVAKGHHVLVPLGADDIFNQETITLPTIDRDGQINSLVKSGIPEDNAQKYSKEAGRNITILKKLLGFPYTRAKWIEKENIREIIPALLMGRWNETFIGDIELVEKLSGRSYLEYRNILNKWRNLEESPLIQIGETWRLTSPLDLWTNLSTYVAVDDLRKLQDCFAIAFKSGNPLIEPKSEQDVNVFFNKKHRYSSWSREGLTQSLILVARFGGGLQMPSAADTQIWVDNIVFDLLSKADGSLWVSVDRELPLISEASPVSFLKCVNTSLSSANPSVMEMFKETESYLHSTSHHTGLLWALEGLAWLPEYLREAALVLLQLSRLDPGGSLANRPLNSIAEVFKPWHYQTLTDYNERMSILKYVVLKEKESGWDLLIRMLPNFHGVAHPTHKMRWRMFDKNTNHSYTYKEIWDTHTYVIELLILLFDGNEKKYAQIINESVSLSPQDRSTVLGWAEANYSSIKQTDYITWDAIRKILNHHRSHPKTKWALQEEELKRYERLYYKMEPQDTVNKYIWLFNDHWPSFPEGFDDNDDEFNKRHEQQQKKIDYEREIAIKLFLGDLGLKKTLELRKIVKEPWSLGDALAKVIVDENQILEISECLNDLNLNSTFIHNFIFRKSILNGFDWVRDLFIKLQHRGFGNVALANLLIPVSQSKILWDFIATLNEEIQSEYWGKVVPYFYQLSHEEKIAGVRSLLKHKRFFSAVNVASHFVDQIDTALLIEILERLATEESLETTMPKGYEIERIFEALDNRSDIDRSTLIRLEWFYLPIFDSYGTRRKPVVLQEELAMSPAFFVEVLKWVYMPKDKKKLEEERNGLSDELIQSRARQAYHLLHSWKKLPGMKSDNTIDASEMKAWIKTARELAENEDRLEVADMQIGQVLAQYPENAPEWPQEKIFDIIEKINTDSIKRNYSAAMFNKRGSSTRGPFDGGEIERGHAKYFDDLAVRFGSKYPNVSDIFKRLAQGYLAQAKRMDEEAERDKLEF